MAWQLHEAGYAVFVLRYRSFMEATDNAPVWDIGNAVREKLWVDQNRQTAALFKGIETAGTAYAKNRTLDNADSLYYAIYHIRPSVGGKDG